MKLEKGIAYCGLACCLCGHGEECPGCRKDGCNGKEWCKSFNCCKAKNISGCHECSEFPCENPMFGKAKIRVFAKFVAEFGEGKLLECLARNEANGMVYHYEGQLMGDYDIPTTDEEIRKLILSGK